MATVRRRQIGKGLRCIKIGAEIDPLCRGSERDKMPTVKVTDQISGAGTPVQPARVMIDLQHPAGNARLIGDRQFEQVRTFQELAAHSRFGPIVDRCDQAVRFMEP